MFYSSSDYSWTAYSNPALDACNLDIPYTIIWCLKLINVHQFVPYYDHTRLLYLILWKQEVIYMVSLLCTFMTNLCLTHDLIKTLESPFETHKIRIKYYISIVLIVPSVLVFILIKFS